MKYEEAIKIIWPDTFFDKLTNEWYIQLPGLTAKRVSSLDAVFKEFDNQLPGWDWRKSFSDRDDEMGYSIFPVHSTDNTLYAFEIDRGDFLKEFTVLLARAIVKNQESKEKRRKVK